MLLPFFEWCETVRLGRIVVGSLWLFPVIEAVHLLALSVLGGAVLVVDLRMLGLGLTNRRVEELWHEARPWMLGALATLVATGVPLFLSEAIKCYYSYPFWVKMTCLFLALIFTFTFQRHVTRSGFTANNPLLSRFTGATSLVLWGGVAWGGRWIAFSG